MLNKLLILSALSLASLNNLSARYPDNTYQETSDPAIEQKINEAVQRAEANTAEKLKNATRRDVVPMWSDKLALENAAIQLEVKRTIANNFKGTESLNSPVIREKLLEILNKSDVTQADLAELQNLVNQYKASRNANNNLNANPNSNTNQAPNSNLQTQEQDVKPLSNTGI